MFAQLVLLLYALVLCCSWRFGLFSVADKRMHIGDTLRLAAPRLVDRWLNRTVHWLRISLTGHMGKEYLSPLALASSLNDVFGSAIVQGFSHSSVGTLATQAHGAGSHEALSRILQRALPLVWIFSLPVVSMLLLLGPLCRQMHMSDAFVSRAATYGLVILPQCALQGMFRASIVWLNAQKILAPVIIISFLAAPVHAALLIVLVKFTPLSWIGTGVAQVADASLQVALVLLYISYSPQTAVSWHGFTREALKGWGETAGVGCWGVLNNCEWLVGEALILCSGLLPRPEVSIAAMSIYQLTNVSIFSVSTSLGLATSVRVSNALGGGDAAGAKNAVQVSLMILLAYVTLPAAILLSYTETWARAATTDADVLDTLRQLPLVLVIYSSADALLAVLNGALVGSANLAKSGRAAIFSYVLVGLPVALLLGFGPLQLGVLGLVLGHTCGKLVHLTANCIYVSRLSWATEMHDAQTRVALIESSQTSSF
jgi:MATE family multidrug resistance protein